MSKLVTVENAKIRLNLDEDGPEDIDLKVSVSLDAATLHLGSLLRTRFIRQTVTDRYWIDPDQEPWLGNFVQYYLTNGFLTDDPVTVRIAETLAGIATGDALNDEILLIERQKGLVLISDEDSDLIFVPQWRFSNQFFTQIEYTCGFITSNTDFGPVFQNVPDWLKEAAMLQTIAVFNGDCGEKDSDCKCTPEVTQLVEPYIRFYPSARKPIL